MLTFLRDLMGHAEWANAVFFHAWEKSPARDHEEMRSRAGHIIGVQQGFLSLLRGEPDLNRLEQVSADDREMRALIHWILVSDLALISRPVRLQQYWHTAVVF